MDLILARTLVMLADDASVAEDRDLALLVAIEDLRAALLVEWRRPPAELRKRVREARGRLRRWPPSTKIQS